MWRCKIREMCLWIHIFWQLTICTMVQRLWIYLLLLLRYVFLISNFDFRFGQEVKVKLGSPFCKYFLTINDLYNGAKIVNLPLAVVQIWFFEILNFDFRFGQEVKVKLGSPFVNIFWQLTICTMVQNCEFTSCGCWDMIFLILNFNFRFVRK